jgi:hypothetical protein
LSLVCFHRTSWSAPQLLMFSQPATGGISTASDVIHAVLCSTLTPICSCSATAPSFATTAHTDLAILTGDQAFCASCFRCRNCKRKIENLRYARTSQGIFCMSCHESLMARRRKKAKGTRSVTGGSNGPGSIASTQVEKALPSLPPGAAPESAFSPEVETPPTEHYSGTPGGRSSAQRTLRSEKDAPVSNFKRDVSPMSDELRRGGFTCAQWLKPYLNMADTLLSRCSNTACQHLQRRPPLAHVLNIRRW